MWYLCFRSNVKLQLWPGAHRPNEATATCQLTGGIHSCVVSLSLWEIKNDLPELSLRCEMVYDG